MKCAEIKLMRRDCRRSMAVTVLIYVLSGLIGGAAAVITAESFGGIAESVFSLEPSSALRGIGVLAVCIAVNSIAVPVFDSLANVCMLSAALWHDRIILGRWLDKRWSSAMKTDQGEVEEHIEMDPIHYRYYWMNTRQCIIVVAATIVPVGYMMVRIDLFYALTVAALALLKFAIPLLAAKKEADFDRREREYNSDRRARETELTSAPHVLRLLGLDGHWCSMLDNRFWSYHRTVILKKSVFDASVGGAKFLAESVITVSVLLIGTAFVAAEGVEPGDVAAMMGYFGVLGGIIDKAARCFRELPIVAGIERRMMLFYEDGERVGGVKFEYAESVSVKAERLSFSYGGETLFENLSFSLEAGEKLALVGGNGSGKSTLIRLLAGLAEPSEGRILVNGRELSETELSSWRSHIAVAMQDPWLAEGTVRENVLMANPDIGNDELFEIMRKTGLNELSEKQISASDAPLSGGEKQRISLARALARKAPLLIVDEPLNHLDREGFGMVKELIRTYSGAVLIVTHEPELADLADKVVWM